MGNQIKMTNTQNSKGVELNNNQVSGDSMKMPDKVGKYSILDNVIVPVEPVSDGTVRMKRTIGLFGAISLILGTMMGSGIFVSPTGVIKNTGSAYLSLVVWAACGFISTLAALSYCELSTVVPKSGGEYAYYQATFKPLNKFVGELPAFLHSWIMIFLLRPSGIAVVSLAFGKYILYPILRMDAYEGCKFQESDDFKLAVKLLALVISSLIAGINIISAKFATNAAIVFLIAKVSTIAIMVGIGLYNLSRGEFGALEGGWDSSDKSVGQIAVSFYSGSWAYDGWNGLNMATEELINPHRTLPLAIIIGIPLCTVFYILINVSYLTALTKPEMIESEAVAVDVGDQYLGPVKLIIPILVAISATGTGNGNMFTTGRVIYASGRDGHMIDVLSYIHATRLTPVLAFALTAAISYLMILVSDIGKLIDLLGFAGWIIYGLAIACVIILRYTMPDAPRPFKVPIIIPVITVLISAALVVLPVVDDPKIEYLAVLGVFGVGVIVYIPFVYKKYRLPYMDEFTRTLQYLTLVVPSPYKED